MRHILVLLSILSFHRTSEACCYWDGVSTTAGMTVAAPKVMTLGTTYTITASAWASGACGLVCPAGCGTGGPTSTSYVYNLSVGYDQKFCNSPSCSVTTAITWPTNLKTPFAAYGDALAVISGSGLAPLAGCDVPLDDPRERYYYTVVGEPLNTGRRGPCVNFASGRGGGGSGGGGGNGGGGGGSGGNGGSFNVTNGNVLLQNGDVSGAAGDRPQLTRTYQNQVAAKDKNGGIFGIGVSSEYDENIGLLISQSATPPLAHRGGDGVIAYYTQSLSNPSIYTGYLQAVPGSQIEVKVDGYTYSDGAGGTRTYNLSGKLTKISPRDGLYTNLTWAGSQLTKVTDSFGNYLSFVADTACPNQVASVSDSTGLIASYTYRTPHWLAPACPSNLASVTYPDGTGYVYNYVDSSSSNLADVRDKAGNILAVYTYDSLNRGKTSQRGDGSNFLSLVYVSTTQTDVTDGEGNKTSFWHEKIGNGLSVVTRVLGKSFCGTPDEAEERSYDGLGNQVSHTDGVGNTEVRDYNANSCLVKITDPMLRTLTFTVDQYCNILNATDANGHTTWSTLDPVTGNATSYTTQTGDVFTIGFTGSLPTSVKNPRGKVTSYAWSAAGDLSKVTDAMQNSTTITRNGRGAVLTVATPKVGTQANTTTLTRDTEGRPLTVKTPNTALHTNTFTNGLLTVHKDPLNRTVSWSRDAALRVVGFTDALAKMTTVTYNTLDELSGITDARAKQYTLVSDGFGHAQKLVWPDGKFETREFDGAGRLRVRTDRRGIKTTFDRDALGRAKSITYDDGTPAVAFTYDAVGNILSVSSNVDTLTFTYDAADRLVSEASLRNAVVFSYSYDQNGNLTLITVKFGQAAPVVFAVLNYDDNDRLTSIVRNGATYSFGYDVAGRPTTITYPNGVITTVAYSADHQITSILAKKGTATRMKAVYAVDLAGNVTRKTVVEYVEDYAVDAENQLLTAKRGTAVVGNFAWDAVGNPAMSGWLVDDSNRLTATPTSTFAHDANGNMVKRLIGGVTWEYTWDALDRMKAVYKDGVLFAAFFYDPFGRRVEKKVGATITKFTYMGSLLFREEAGATMTQYVNLGLPLAVENGATITYLHTDALRSVLKGTSSAGVVVWTRAYSSFGALTGNTASGPAFTGYYYDSETGLHNSPARVYDPTLGRFLSEDPSMFDDGFNLYRYTRNRPHSMYDLTGLKPSEAGLMSALSQEALSIRQGHQSELMTYDQLVRLAELYDESQELIDGAIMMGLGNVQAGRTVGLYGEVQACIKKENKLKITGPITKKVRFPDELLLVYKMLREIKNVKYLAFTRQLRDFLAYAEANFGHGRMTIDIRALKGTKLAQTLQELEKNGRIIFRRYLKCCE